MFVVPCVASVTLKSEQRTWCCLEFMYLYLLSGCYQAQSAIEQFVVCASHLRRVGFGPASTAVTKEVSTIRNTLAPFAGASGLFYGPMWLTKNYRLITKNYEKRKTSINQSYVWQTTNRYLYLHVRCSCTLQLKSCSLVDPATATGQRDVNFHFLKNLVQSYKGIT